LSGAKDIKRYIDMTESGLVGKIKEASKLSTQKDAGADILSDSSLKLCLRYRYSVDLTTAAVITLR